MGMIQGTPPQNLENEELYFYGAFTTLNISETWWVHLSPLDRKSNINRHPECSHWVGGLKTILGVG